MGDADPCAVALPPDPGLATTTPTKKKSACHTCGGDDDDKEKNDGSVADGKKSDLDHMFGGSNNGEPQVTKVAANTDLQQHTVKYIGPDGNTWTNSWSQMNVDANTRFLESRGLKILSITPSMPGK